LKTRNNGNIQSETLTVAQLRSPTTNAIISPKLSLTESYTYDAVNRLVSAEEKNGSSQVWKQSYTYKNSSETGDQFGNRRIDEENTTPNLRPEQQLEQQLNPLISSTNNRIEAGQGYDYDAAGNVTKSPIPGGFRTYSYDAQNRQIKLDGGATTYTYDGEGRRIKKVTVNEMTTITTIFVYNAMGQLISEYAPFKDSEKGVRFLTPDHLGSTRVITDASAVVKIQSDIAKVVKERLDYLPFGEEIATSFGNRAAVTGYSGMDATRQKFTGKERDEESGLDYFLARYYASAHGRFTSADPLLASGVVRAPQTWNRYAYVLNNPTNNIDPLGLACSPSPACPGSPAPDQVIAEESQQEQQQVPRVPPARPPDPLPTGQGPLTPPPLPSKPLVDIFDVGLPPVPRTGSPIPALSSNSEVGNQIRSLTLVAGDTEVLVVDQRGNRLVSDGKTYIIDEEVEIVDRTPDTPASVRTGSDFLSAEGTHIDQHSMVPAAGYSKFSDNARSTVRQIITVTDVRTENTYIVGLNLITQSVKGGVEVKNCNYGGCH
jgi:RHS repeat-associated protein